LSLFCLVNVWLWRIKRRATDSPPPDAPCYPIWLPTAGAIVCGVFLAVNLAAWIWRV
jgi:hypothetical protein